MADTARYDQSQYDRPADWAAPGAALVAAAARETIPDFDELGRVHIVGIAGAGMSALARLLLDRGVAVSGCEAADSAVAQALREQGAQVLTGHSLQHLDDIDTVVYSTAIAPDHLELSGARQRGLPTLRRASALAAVIAGSRTVAIAGTHGKTTTTALLTVAMLAAGLDPSYAIGGNLAASGSNAGIGTGASFLVEADESDGSFLLLRPEIAVITNVEADHLENHGDLEGVFRAFEQFVDRIVAGGLLLVCADDPGARRIAAYARNRQIRVRTYGTDPAADLVVTAITGHPDSVEFTVTEDGVPQQLTVSSLIGAHIALNACAAFGVARELGVAADLLASTWHSFAGVGRRFEFRGEARGVRVYDDYAHHPTEVRAQLSAARSILNPGGRLIAVFQPGTYSRTQTFAAEFADALAVADIAVVLDIFAAREVPLPGVTGELIARLVPLPAQDVHYLPDKAALAGLLAALARAGDVVLTMGIGDVYQACPDILTALAGTHR